MGIRREIKKYPIKMKMPKLTPEGQIMLAQVIANAVLLIIKQFKKKRNVHKKQNHQNITPEERTL